MEEETTHDLPLEAEPKPAAPKWTRRLSIVFIAAGVLVLAYFLLTKDGGLFGPGKTTIITSSTLTDTINISELSTAEFIYNGIARIYEKANPDQVKCNILYYATVKAGIDMKDVQFTIDDDKKTITATLPELKITSNTVDSKKLKFLPENADIELADAIAACEKDALDEASKEGELIETAKENLKANIEALLLPLLQNSEYEILWD